MRFRLGVHMGDVLADEEEVFGDDVNIAVRLEAVAVPGGVAVSAKAYHEASRHLSTSFVDAGSHRLKNIEETIDVWTWQPGGSKTRGPEPRDISNLPAQYRTAIVGVLPFANLSDSTDEYFSDGLTQDLIHALSLQSFYRVLSRSSTFSFKGKNLSARLIAREIDATYLIQGSVRRAGTKIRVTAELIAPENGEQLWTGRYDRDMGELFAMQDEITTSLSAAIAPEIYRAEASVPPRSLSTDLTAWDRFLRGLSHYYQQTKSDFEASIALFREAIALDPALSIARAYLATIQVQGVQYGWIKSTHQLWTEAMELAGSSVRLDPRSSFAFSILSYVHAMQSRYEAALDAARKAVELNPYDMGARGVLGICHLVIGEHRQAIELFSMAAQRGNSDPRYQWAALNAFSHYLLGQYDASLSWAREALYLNPNHLQVLAVRAAALAQSGRTEEAAKATEVLLSNFPGLTVQQHILEEQRRHHPHATGEFSWLLSGITLATKFIANTPKPKLPPGVPPQYAGMMLLQSPRIMMICKLGDLYWERGQEGDKDKAETVVDEERLAVFRDFVNSLDLPELPDEPGAKDEPGAQDRPGGRPGRG